eukprot:SAG31_NODE_26859_length_435_cov_0.919643_1_plen_81_part_01
MGSFVHSAVLILQLLMYKVVPWDQVAKACIAHKRNMVTTSYVSKEMEALHPSAQRAGITILNEVGLDPGIDHLTAMRIIDG